MAGDNAREQALTALAAYFGERMSRGQAVCGAHAGSLTWLPAEPPDAVVWPLNPEEVARIVALARDHRVPIVAFGAGTSLEGQVNAPSGGICVDFSRMNRILRVSPPDQDVTVEAGVTLDALNAHLRHDGLFFPVDPGAGIATLGGMAATRASGTTTVRYGAMRENVLGLKAVMANGDIITTSSRARKSAAGYDLTRLLIGSEGTLGLIVELTLRLQPRAEATRVSVQTFATVAAAAEAAIAILQSGVTPQRLEFLDAAMLRTVNAQSGTRLPEDGPALFIELAGTGTAVAEHATIIEALASSCGARSSETAESSDGQRALWKARHDCFWSVRSAWPGHTFTVTDVCVPISRLADCLGETAADIEAFGLTAPIVGHVGDGNFHAIAVHDPADAEQRQRLDRFLERLAERAIVMEGTCTGEHGIGQGKARFLEREHGRAVDTMRLIKSALDPLGILNPGKIFSAANG